MTLESIVGIVSGSIAIVTTMWALYQRLKKQSLKDLMAQLVNQDLSREQHQKILKKMNRRLGHRIKRAYIQSFVLNNRSKEIVFMDICDNNDIEPTKELCIKFLEYDMKKFRKTYNEKRTNNAPS